MKNYLLFTVLLSVYLSQAQVLKDDNTLSVQETSIVILGTTQDAGSPQIGCRKECCAALFVHPDASRMVVSLGLIDAFEHKTYLFEATPDISRQMKILTQSEPVSDKELVDGIFLTHAHIGHYTGLMYLGKEAIDAKQMPLYVMPKMKQFLSENGPWDQLVNRQNLSLIDIEHEGTIKLSEDIEVTPLLVPHRDEYSETVGYRIKGPKKTALFIPDIDKWSKWKKDIIEEIRNVDYAFLDATFFSGKEINNRDISEIPHPFVIESLEIFKNLSDSEKSKIIFIHFNHTNPLLNRDSQDYRQVIEQGFKVAKTYDLFKL